MTRPGLKPQPEVSLRPSTLPCLCACLRAPAIATLTPGVRGQVGDRVPCTSWPCSVAFYVCFLLLLRQRNLLNALLTLLSLQFQEEERTLNWGSIRAAIPEHPCVCGCPTSYLGSGCAGEEELGHMHKVLIRGVWAPGVVQGGQGSRAGLFSRSSFAATARGGRPSAIYNRGMDLRGRDRRLGDQEASQEVWGISQGRLLQGSRQR